MALVLDGSNDTITGLQINSANIVNGSITADDLASGVGGKILQVQQTVKTDVFTTNSTSLVDITGMSVSITPSATTSKVLVLVSYCHSHTQSNRWSLYTLLRGSTQIYLGDASSNRSRASTFNSLIGASGDSVDMKSSQICFLDTPNTTSATTYKLQCKTQDSNHLTFNRAGGDGDYDFSGRTASSITAMEIAA
tara:strand:- start:567 stop:1148 length:582 start_codon:yes stop_codon:yes gene_type:complete